MSPEPSIAGSQDGSPTRFRGTSRHGSLQDITNIAKVAGKKTSIKSLQSQGSPRRPKIGSKPYRRGSGDHELDSEDEINPLLVPSKSQTPSIVSRRKHPSDVQAISIKVDNLEDAVFKIQKMVATILEAQVSTQARHSAFDNDALAKRHRDSLQVANRSGKVGLRPISDISSASATTNATYGSTTQASAASGDASLTDPFEYEDIPVIRPGTAKSNKSVATALHRPPPVAQVIPKGRLPEETSLLSKGEDWQVDEEGRKRLSVNHSFTTTDMMDQGLDRSLMALSALG